MIEKESAKRMKGHALAAIEELSRLLIVAKEACSPEEFQSVSLTVARAMTPLMIDLLDNLIYTQHPDLDHIVR